MENNKYQSEALKVDRPTYDDLAERLDRHKGQLRLIHAQMGLSGDDRMKKLSND